MYGHPVALTCCEQMDHSLHMLNNVEYFSIFQLSRAVPEVKYIKCRIFVSQYLSDNDLLDCPNSLQFLDWFFVSYIQLKRGIIFK